MYFAPNLGKVGRSESKCRKKERKKRRKEERNVNENKKERMKKRRTFAGIYDVLKSARYLLVNFLPILQIG